MPPESSLAETLPENEMNHTAPPKIIAKEYLIPFSLLTVCFALWGAANNMTDMLVPAFQRVMSMTQLQSSLIQMAFYGAYFCMAIPAAIVIKKCSYKTGVVTGLMIYATGAALCYPASQSMSFDFFLVAFYVFAAGCAFLETSVAPYVVSMGPEATATQRINLAQAFNPVGSICGLFLGKHVILAGLDKADDAARAFMPPEQLAELQGKELSNVVLAYLIVGAISLILAATIIIQKFPKSQESNSSTVANAPENGFVPTLTRLLKNKNYIMAVIAQFFYVGCQIGVWTYTIKYLMVNNKEPLEAAVAKATAIGEKVTMESIASNYMIYGLVLFIASRFICTYLMKFFDPARLLTIIATVALALCSIVIWKGGPIGGYALVGISGCMSLMFPTIYGLGLTGLNDNDRKLGGSGIIMAIVGGAILVPIQGFLIDGKIPPPTILVDGATVPNDFPMIVILRNIMSPIKSMLGEGYLYSVNNCYLLPFVCFAIIAVYGLIAHKKEEKAGLL